MRITLLIGSLENTGGSERSLSNLVNAWAEAGRAVTILTFDSAHEPAYSLHPSIRRRCLGIYGRAAGLLRRIRQIFWRHKTLRAAIAESRPDIVLSFTPEANVRTILATRGMHVPVIVSERTDPALYDIGWKLKILRSITYPFADLLVCQTRSALARFQKMTRVKGCVIPNLIAVPETQTPRRLVMAGEPKGRILVAMGRLSPQKGFDLLLRAFSKIMLFHPSWSLKILGTGPLNTELRKMAKDLKVAEKVEFVGVRHEPFPDLCHADLFVLSSRFEGFPNALCEAMACGLPAVSFDCPSGPGEIIRHERNGILVPPEDVDALASALDDLMTDDAKRAQFALRAQEILDRFPAKRILSMWDVVLTKLARRGIRLPHRPTPHVNSF